MWGTIRQQVALLMELEGVADPEQELIARLTEAHEAAARRQPPPEDHGVVPPDA